MVELQRTNYYSEYENLSKEIFGQLKTQYLRVIAKARKPAEAHNLFIETVMKPKMGQVASKMSELGTINNFRKKLEDIYCLDNEKEKPEIFNLLIEEIEPSKRDQSIKLLAEQQADVLMDEFWFESDKQHEKNQIEIQNEILLEFKSKLFWKMKNETEFVQFAYSLQRAGYLGHESKRITDLVEDLARFFNFPLGKNWQVNLSSSIHKRNSDYKPQIFDDINLDNLEDAYEKFKNQKLDRKKKN